MPYIDAVLKGGPLACLMNADAPVAMNRDPPAQPLPPDSAKKRRLDGPQVMHSLTSPPHIISSNVLDGICVAACRSQTHPSTRAASANLRPPL